ncbi:ubiquitin-like protein Pup [Corynebacterium renale]|uniref:Prokaryotic ubiquitin-like protein Pup n=1 Tax=Corynebacterium renale TaxID=1724 RepID=A0A2A9DRE3_9CORY|nr:ubiquitin-like protein Pup [Corynebacterium renale]PFG28725.1 ubiquitin-like protein Pup [Corynebacterium renale]SQI26028.1 ubiquitin-like protein pup [Corynebacterium renale]
MAQQGFTSSNAHDNAPDDHGEEHVAAPQIDTQSADDLLAEIDDLLEENAEEFVNSYVQKGGQ